MANKIWLIVAFLSLVQSYHFFSTWEISDFNGHKLHDISLIQSEIVPLRHEKWCALSILDIFYNISKFLWISEGNEKRIR